jgi:hypothetical protein
MVLLSIVSVRSGSMGEAQSSVLQLQQEGSNPNGTFLFISFGCFLSSSEEQQSAEGPKNWRLIKLKLVGTSSEVLLGHFRDQAQQAKFLWGVERMTHRGLPNNFGPVRWRALAAKQIDSKLVAN